MGRHTGNDMPNRRDTNMMIIILQIWVDGVGMG